MSAHSQRTTSPKQPRKRKEPSAPKAEEPLPSNRLLAGYMAYEFLTRGTLLGQEFEQAGAEAAGGVASGSSSAADSKRTKKSEAEPSGKNDQRSYTEVATILKSSGAHVAGVVNPAQLARWIQM